MILELSSYDDPIHIKGVVHLDEIIEDLTLREPKDKRSTAHKVWKHDYNLTVDTVNKLAGFKRYIKK